MQRKDDGYTYFPREEDSPKVEAKNRKNRDALLWQLKIKEWADWFNYFSSPEKSEIIAELSNAIREAPPNSSFDTIFNDWKDKERKPDSGITNFHFLAKPRWREKEATATEDFANKLKTQFKGKMI